MKVDLSLPFGPESEVLDDLESMRVADGWMTTATTYADDPQRVAGFGDTKQESIHDYYLNLEQGS